MALRRNIITGTVLKTKNIGHEVTVKSGKKLVEKWVEEKVQLVKTGDFYQVFIGEDLYYKGAKMLCAMQKFNEI